ncbi:MAG: hypothetical protein INQ03_09935 [Candidatus Heimdallarchaeota archaeon]|nr:hypothetical protein [Candidatus Heimdallarchaeota archaeon]
MSCSFIPDLFLAACDAIPQKNIPRNHLLQKQIMRKGYVPQKRWMLLRLENRPFCTVILREKVIAEAICSAERTYAEAK